MLQYLSPDSCSCTMCPHRSGIFYYLTTHSLLWISHPSDLHSDFSVNLLPCQRGQLSFEKFRDPSYYKMVKLGSIFSP